MGNGAQVSEETFTWIADGRLPRGWDDQAVIDILRFEVIAAAGKVPGKVHGTAPASRAADQFAWIKLAVDVKKCFR